MNLNVMKLSLAAGITVAIAYTLCALVVALAPATATQLMGWLTHLVDINQSGQLQVTFGSYLLGLIQSLVYSAFFTAVLASIYNKLLK